MQEAEGNTKRRRGGRAECQRYSCREAQGTMPPQARSDFKDPEATAVDVKEGLIYFQAAMRLAQPALNAIEHYASYARARADMHLSELTMKVGFFGHLRRRGYAASTITNWSHLIRDLNDVTPETVEGAREKVLMDALHRAVGHVGNQTERVDRRSGVTLEDLTGYVLANEEDLPGDLEYRSFAFMLILTGNRPRHIRQLTKVKLTTDPPGFAVKWMGRKQCPLLHGYLTYPFEWTMTPPDDVRRFLTTMKKWTLGTPDNIASVFGMWRKRRAVRLGLPDRSPTLARGILSLSISRSKCITTFERPYAYTSGSPSTRQNQD
jgi:hypothetical protein